MGCRPSLGGQKNPIELPPRCTETEGLTDYNLCYEKYLEENMNCSLPWRKQHDATLPDCNTDAQKDFLSNVTKDIESMGEMDVYKGPYTYDVRKIF